ncbi:MAG: isoaspartyl peptidase/L-asparaginase family protein [Candidatus Binataceae bacterium]
MPRGRKIPALAAHGGAGAPGPAAESSGRRRGMLAAVRAGAAILRCGGGALDAVSATVAALEDHPLFNAGYGSVLNSVGRVEMDASVMEAVPRAERTNRAGESAYLLRAGGVAAIGRVRNPVYLARAVMERTPHLLMVGAGAERFARSVGIKLCRPEELISPRARERWRSRRKTIAAREHGTVGAVAIDSHGTLAAATSTGGWPGKLPGRVGDSAIIGAGTFANWLGAASATGNGEAIIVAALCREAVLALKNHAPGAAARDVIARLSAASGAEAGIVLIDRRGRIGYAHNAAMEVATFDPAAGLRHLRPAPVSSARRS